MNVNNTDSNYSFKNIHPEFIMVNFNQVILLVICSLAIRTSAVPLPEYEPTSNTPANGFNTMPTHPLGGGAATIREQLSPRFSSPNCENGTPCDSYKNKELALSPPMCEDGTSCGSSVSTGNFEGKGVEF
jgi:hypothetical protein